MIKKTVTYDDFNGNSRTDELYFHLGKAELTEMELSKEGGLANYYQQIVDSQSVPELAKIFKELLVKSYGVKTADGKGFKKLDENGNPLWVEFSQTAAYEALYMELITDTDKAIEFFNGIIPSDLRQNNKPAMAVVPPEAK